MMYPLHALWYAKMHKSGRNDVEKWKNLACNDVIHFLVWRHQPINQSIEINFNNFFQIHSSILGTLLSLILPSHYCQGAVRLVSGQYYFCEKVLTLWIPNIHCYHTVWLHKPVMWASWKYAITELFCANTSNSAGLRIQYCNSIMLIDTIGLSALMYLEEEYCSCNW